MKPRVSVVVPAYNEGPAVVTFLDRILEAVTLPAEVLVVYDTPDDTTVPHLEAYTTREPRLRPTHNTYGRGPAAAIRFGVDHAKADVVVVTMADGSDDPMQIDLMRQLVLRYPPAADAPWGYPLVLRTGRSDYWPEIPSSMLDGANSRPLRPSSSDRTPFMNASLKVRPIAIASPTDFICVVSVRSACGNFSKFHRGILTTT